MRENSLKRQFQEGKVAHGTFCAIKDPAVVEMLGIAGYDFVIIDMEHSSASLSEIQNMVRTAELVGISPIIRVPQSAPGWYLRAAETGAHGVLVPHVTSADATRELVQAIKYPPVGDRGLDPTTRSADYGALPVQEHMDITNKEIMAMVMIEDLEAVENLEEIISVPGLDLIFIGPSDLSRACGVAGELSHEEVNKVVEKIFNVVKQYPHIKTGIPAFQADDVPALVKLGANMITCPPVDTIFLVTSLKSTLEEIKSSYGA